MFQHKRWRPSPLFSTHFGTTRRVANPPSLYSMVLSAPNGGGFNHRLPTFFKHERERERDFSPPVLFLFVFRCDAMEERRKPLSTGQARGFLPPCDGHRPRHPVAQRGGISFPFFSKRVFPSAALYTMFLISSIQYIQSA